MKIDNEKITYKDYFFLLGIFSWVLGLILLTFGPLVVGLVLGLLISPYFLFILLIYIPLIPLLFILWVCFDNFMHGIALD